MKYLSILISLVICSVCLQAQVPAPGNSPASTERRIFTKVEIPPSFPGGTAVMRNCMRRYMGAHPWLLTATDSVTLRFIVLASGHITDLFIADSSTNLAKAALDFIRLYPRWLPARQNGQTVDAYRELVINFAKAAAPVCVMGEPTPAIALDELQTATVSMLLHTDPDTEIISYQFTADDSNGVLHEIANKGSHFNMATRNQLSRLTAGALVTFDNIRVRKNGLEHKIPSVAYFVSH